MTAPGAAASIAWAGEARGFSDGRSGRPTSRAAAWIRYALLLLIVALPLVHPTVGLNPIFVLFIATVCLDAIGRFRCGVLLAIAFLPLAIRFDWIGWMAWCLLLPRAGWLFGSPARLLTVASLFLGVYVGRQSLALAISFTGIVTYAVFVLDTLKPQREIRTDFQPHWILQVALCVLLVGTFKLGGERFWFAINPNIDGIIIGALLSIIGANLLALGVMISFFRSRSGVLSVLFRWARIEPRHVHLVLAAMFPLLLVMSLASLPWVAGTTEGPERLLSLNDGSNAHRAESLVSALAWTVENPDYLAGANDATRAIYLDYNGIFPHHAFLFSALNDGILVFAAYFSFLWMAYGRMQAAGRTMVLSLLIGFGFSDLGFDYVFLTAIIGAALLMDRRSNLDTCRPH